MRAVKPLEASFHLESSVYPRIYGVFFKNLYIWEIHLVPKSPCVAFFSTENLISHTSSISQNYFSSSKTKILSQRLSTQDFTIPKQKYIPCLKQRINAKFFININIYEKYSSRTLVVIILPHTRLAPNPVSDSPARLSQTYSHNSKPTTQTYLHLSKGISSNFSFYPTILIKTFLLAHDTF